MNKDGWHTVKFPSPCEEEGHITENMLFIELGIILFPSPCEEEGHITEVYGDAKVYGSVSVPLRGRGAYNQVSKTLKRYMLCFRPLARKRGI